MYLKGQNLEQMHQFDEAVECYEQAVSARFDAAGPYDRLLHLYREAEADTEVVRVAEAALANVRTHEQKTGWYTEMRYKALLRLKDQPDKRGPEF